MKYKRRKLYSTNLTQSAKAMPDFSGIAKARERTRHAGRHKPQVVSKTGQNKTQSVLYKSFNC